MINIIKPHKLKPGDTVAVVSPSKTIANRKEDAEKARHKIERALGIKLVFAPNAFARHYYSAGTAQQRVDDLHWAIGNPDIKGVISSVGGDTAIELVDKLDYDLIRDNPKVFAGISDATTLQIPILVKSGLVTFSGLEFMNHAKHGMAYELESMKRAWLDGELGKIEPNPNWRSFDGSPSAYKGWRTIREGVAEGRIIGSNFSSFAQFHGTQYSPDYAGNIIVMEAYMWSKNKIHQALAQLRLRGILDQISGLVVGYCVGSDNPNVLGNERDIAELALEATDGYDFPIMQIGEVGHYVENTMLPVGAKARFDATQKTFEITESVAV